MKAKQKKVILISLVLAMLLVIGTIIGIVCYENHLDKVQENALLELEEKKGEYNENKIVLSDTSKKEAEKLAQKLGAELRITKNGQFATLTLPKGVLVEDIYKDDSNRQHLEEMSLDYYVRLAEIEETEETTEEELLVGPNYVVNESDYHLQSYLNYINIGNVWNNTLGTNKDGKKVKIAVIDTGIDTDHPEFFDADGNSIISLKSYDATNDKIVEMYDISVIEDTNGHGTAVAGVIAAQMDGYGIVGISPEIELVVIKCELNDYGTLSSSEVNFAIYYAIEQDVDVINMSLSGQGGNSYAEAIQLAIDSDIIPVAAAGNALTDSAVYPAADTNVIGVGALAQDSWEIAGYSNFGVNSDIMAPGTTYTATIGGGYTYKNGTSMSCPIVTSAVALYVSHNKYVNYYDLKDDILAAGKDLGDLGEDDYYGFGCLDISAFILEEKGKITYDYCTEDIESTTQVFVKQHTIQTVVEPERENIIFDNWYYDKAYTRVFDYDKYYTTEFVEDVTLYAKWVNEDDEGASVYNYKTLGDGTIEIISYKGKRRYLTIPDTIDDKTVSSIGYKAFANNSRLRGVTLPTDLVTINSMAFYYAKDLREVTFTGDKLITIGASAFENCKLLREIQISDGVQVIGSKAFLNCLSLKAIEITENSSLTSIGEKAFSGTTISSIYIPEKANFDGSIVVYCEKLRSVTIHSENTNYTVENSTVYNADKTRIVYHPAALSGVYIVNENVVSIEAYAFAASNISAANMSNNVINIGEYAFARSNINKINLSENLTEIPTGTFESSKLTSVHIPENIETIGIKAFASCEYLTELTFADNSKLSIIDGSGIEKTEGAFYNCSQLQSFVLPESVTYIGDYAFYGCSKITELVIPANVTNLGIEAFSLCNCLANVKFADDCALTNVSRGCFRNCTSLQTVDFSEKIQKIESDCFNSCGMLSELTFAENSQLVEIGERSFYSCKSLKEMQLPNGVTKIGTLAYAFSGLENVNVGATVATIGKGAFGACFSLTVIKVDQSNTNFKAVNNVLFDHDITTVYCVPASKNGSYTIPESVKCIASYALYYCRYLEEVILPSQLEDIQDSSFYYCTGLAEIEIPAKVFNIGRKAFYCCYNLTSVSFAENSAIERLGIYTFYKCGLKSFTVPASVTSMAQYVFYCCDDLNIITFEKNSKLTYVSAYMFSGCNSLKNIVFEDGSSITSIRAHGFDGVTNLENVYFGNAKIENIDNYAFYNATNLNQFTIPSTVTYIGRYAFYNCQNFERFDLPECIDYIGESAFNNGLNNVKVFFAAEELPEYAQEGWDMGITGYFLNAKEYVQTTFGIM